jgi:hypothetical protein
MADSSEHYNELLQPLKHSREIVPQSLLNTVKHRTMVIIKLQDCTTHLLTIVNEWYQLAEIKEDRHLKPVIEIHANLFCENLHTGPHRCLGYKIY